MTPMNHRLLVPRRAPTPAPPPALTLYFNDAAFDGDWGNVLNWWTDEACTIQAVAIPAASDDAILLATCYLNSGLPAACNTLAIPDAENSGYSLLDIQVTATNGAVFGGSSSTGGCELFGGAVFSDNSFHSGNLTGGAVFNDNSFNAGGVILGNATFNDNSSNNGTVTGTVTCNTTGTCTPQP